MKEVARAAEPTAGETEAATMVVVLAVAKGAESLAEQGEVKGEGAMAVEKVVELVGETVAAVRVEASVGMAVFAEAARELVDSQVEKVGAGSAVAGGLGKVERVAAARVVVRAAESVVAVVEVSSLPEAQEEAALEVISAVDLAVAMAAAMVEEVAVAVALARDMSCGDTSDHQAVPLRCARSPR